MKCSHDIDLRNAREMLLVSLVEYALENVNLYIFLPERGMEKKPWSQEWFSSLLNCHITVFFASLLFQFVSFILTHSRD